MDTLREEDGLHTGRSANPSESTLNQLKTPVIEQSDPGSPPFTRGIYSGMYLDKLWTMRQYAGVICLESRHSFSARSRVHTFT